MYGRADGHSTMIRATWNEWFVEDFEGADVDGLTVWYLGANGFVVKSPETVVYIDPYFGIGEHRPYAVRMCPIPMDPANATVCDAVLVTHEHCDHMHPPSYAPLLECSDAPLYAPEICFENPDHDGPLHLPDEQRNVVAPDDEFTVGDLSVTVCTGNDPDSREPVSFVVEHESGTFYHGGDTKYMDDLTDIGERFDVTLAAFAFGTVGQFYQADEGESRPIRWYMDGDEVIRAANALRVEQLVPTHWDLWKGFEGDPKVLHEHATSMAYPRTVEVARVGDRIDVGRPGIVPPEYAR